MITNVLWVSVIYSEILNFVSETKATNVIQVNRRKSSYTEFDASWRGFWGMERQYSL